MFDGVEAGSVLALSSALLGGGLIVAGVACLYASWKGLCRRTRWLIPLGWLLLVAAAGAWVVACGLEFGLSVALLGVSVTAWGVVIINATPRPAPGPARGDKPMVARPLTFNRWRAGQSVLLFIAAVPLAGLVAAFVSIALSRMLPWARVNEMVLAVLIMPVLWGGAAYWVCADAKLLRPAASLLAAGSLSALIVYM